MIELTLGERLEDLIKETGKSYRTISKELKDKYDFSISAGTISKLISNEEYNNPKAETIIYLSKYFGVSADYLLGLSNVKTTDTNLQAVCNFTGLDTSSVDLILKAKNKKELDSLIESGILFILSAELSDYKKASKEFIDVYEDKTPIPKGKTKDKLLEKYSDKMDRALFNASREVTKLFERNNEKFIKEQDKYLEELTRIKNSKYKV